MIVKSRTCWLVGIERVLLTLWVGGMWITGYLVAPTLFASLDSRQLAGQLAGQIFQSMNYIGLVIGSCLLISALWVASSNRFREWRVWALVLMLLIVTIATFIIQPMMQELKGQGIAEGSAQAIQFGRLHGVSSVLFLLNSLLGLLLVGIGFRQDNLPEN